MGVLLEMQGSSAQMQENRKHGSRKPGDPSKSVIAGASGMG